MLTFLYSIQSAGSKDLTSTEIRNKDTTGFYENVYVHAFNV